VTGREIGWDLGLGLEERSTNNHESKKGETADSLLRYSALADSWIP
jgi:hypothetical protein